MSDEDKKKRADELLDQLDAIKDRDAWRAIMIWFAVVSGVTDTATVMEAVIRRAHADFSPAVWGSDIKNQADAIARTFEMAGFGLVKMK